MDKKKTLDQEREASLETLKLLKSKPDEVTKVEKFEQPDSVYGTVRNEKIYQKSLGISKKLFKGKQDSFRQVS